MSNRMILRTGIDLVEVERLSQLRPSIRERFLQRVFTATELMDSDGNNTHLAGRFAAKEAVSKALGCGIGKVTWQQIEILTDENGSPQLVLHGRASEVALAQHLDCWSVSITHTKSHASAIAVAMGSLNFQDEDGLKS